MARVHFILYVHDQQASTRFYRAVLARPPSLDVPGMTEFAFGDAVLGLMPEAGITRLLGDRLPEPRHARGVPRAEVYLVVEIAERRPYADDHRVALARAVPNRSSALNDGGHAPKLGPLPLEGVNVINREGLGRARLWA